MLPYIAIEQFGLHLHQIRDTDAELVRQGRNQPFVRRNHFYEEIITPIEHRIWYESINKSSDYYFVASKEGVPMGLLYLRNIVPGMLSGEIGVFFWSEKLLRTRIPILAIFTFVDFFMFSANLQVLQAKVKPENHSMVHIIRFFGFDFNVDEHRNMINGTLSQSDYMKRRTTLMNFAQRLHHDRNRWALRIEGDRDLRHQPEILRLIP